MHCVYCVLQKREARREEQANNPHYLRGELPVKKVRGLIYNRFYL